MIRAGILLGRLVFNGFFVLTAVYCLLAYHPFTYERVVKDQIIGWLTWFVRLHPLWYWAAQGVAALTLLPDLKRPETRRYARLYLLLAAVSAVAMSVHPVLAQLRNDRSSLAWALAALTPILALALNDHLVGGRLVVWGGGQPSEIRRLFRVAVLSGLFVFAIFSLLFLLRLGAHAAEFPWRAKVVVFGSSLLLHLIPFTVGFLVLSLIQAIASFWPRPARIEFALVGVLALILIARCFRNLVFPAMAFTGWAATVMSTALALALVVVLSGLALRLREGNQAPVESGVTLLLRPLSVVPTGSRLASGIGLVCLAALAAAMTAGAGVQDWNGLVQQLSALLSWALVLAALVCLLPSRPGPDATTLLALLTVVGLVTYRTFVVQRSRLPAFLGAPGLDASLLLDRYAGYEPSFRFLHELLQSRVKDDQGFFDFLQRHTNLPQSFAIAPVEIRFSKELRASATRPPNVLMVVVDSMRPDYLSPFNPAVTFTPNIARFGADADLFTNAFTHYGATGLSEPSIWVGGMMPHKQYIQPFSPLNALHTLLRAEGFERYVSVDNVLRSVLDVDEQMVRLDADVQVKDYDLCRSLREFQDRLDRRADKTRPVFLYTQAQNLHIARITRENKTNLTGKRYPGFYEPYASRVERLDGCFGALVDHLKASGEWENSIVILTADHGDSLGEEGRWGHAYMVNPEVIRIPLIIHLPPKLRGRFFVDPRRMAFSTDITPSLYRLLGHPPTLQAGPLGSPLYLSAKHERPRRDWQLVASSYGPVYGILSDGGARLFVADAVNYIDTAYDLGEGAPSRRPVTPDMRAEGYQRIRQAIQELHAFYRIPSL